MAGRYDLKIDQGANFSRVITWKDANDDPIDLTGYTARLQIRQKVNSTATYLTLSNGVGITLGGTAGTIAISLTDTQTAAFDFTSAVYNLEIESPTSVTTRLLEGYVYVSREVVR